MNITCFRGRYSWNAITLVAPTDRPREIAQEGVVESRGTGRIVDE